MPVPNAHPSLAAAMESRGYTDPTPVQRAVLDPALDGRDLLVSAATGSGKTVAFGLALAPQLLDGAPPEPKRPLALIVAPTRELATQVQQELSWLYAPTGSRVISCVGGMDIRRQMFALGAAPAIVVGTPGRLCDLVDRNALQLDGIRALVLDEADEMLDMGFREELERLLSSSPKQRRTLLFSVTLPERILQLTGSYQRDAARVSVEGAEGRADIHYKAMLVAASERDRALVNVLRHEESPGALVFVARRDDVRHLTAQLVERGFEATALSGEFTQAERDRALSALRSGRARVLVATDVAARGLDVPDLGLVVHVDLPLDSEVLLHRSGRTGRAGRKGQAVLLVPPEKRLLARRLSNGAGVKLDWVAVPGADEIRARDQDRLFEALEPDDEPGEDDRAVARRLLEAHDPELLVASMVAVQRQRSPDAEDLPQTTALLARFMQERQQRRDRPPERPHPGQRAGEYDQIERRPHGPPSRGHQAEGVWFRIDVGRADNAAAGRLLPIICRRGAVHSGLIGRIRVMEHETHFEVHPSAAQSFEAASRRPDRRDPDVRIQRLRDR